MTAPDPEAPLVTGMGWVTPLGADLDSVWQALLSGRSGACETPSTVGLRSSVTFPAPTSADAATPAQRNHAMAVGAIRSACEDAGVAPDAPGVRLVLGTSFGSHLDDVETESLSAWGRLVADEIGHAAPPVCVSTACSAGSDSLLIGSALIRSGQADVCICLGVDVVTAAKRIGHSLLGTMSSDALRAFDQRRSGMLLGEGAGALVLEAPAHARARGARVHAVLCGAGSANDASGMTAPDPSGASIVLAVTRSLKASGLGLEDIAVVSAHGTGTPLNDAVEAKSLHTLFGARTVPPIVYGTKGALGHSLGACGTIEAITLIQALRNGDTAPIHGLEQQMDDFRLPLAATTPVRHSGRAGLSLTLGFGGFNTALLFALPEAAHV